MTLETTPDEPVPGVIGINWHGGFDEDSLIEKKGPRGKIEWWIREDADLRTPIRGGHAIAIIDDSHRDLPQWYRFYDQGREGACVGFAWSRVMSLLNRRMYFARWLWDRSKERDYWADTNPGDDNGTSTRVAGEVLLTDGHVAWTKAKHAPLQTDHVGRAKLTPKPHHGIQRFRNAMSVDDMRAALKSPSHDARQAFPLANSWALGYPQVVHLPYVVMERLLNRDADAHFPVDR